MIRTLIALALLATPALADTTHQCEDGSTLTVRGGSRPDVVIKRADEIDIALPYRANTMYGKLWTPRQQLASQQCDDFNAPCAQEGNGDFGLLYWYVLDKGKTVWCPTE